MSRLELPESLLELDILLFLVVLTTAATPLSPGRFWNEKGGTENEAATLDSRDALVFTTDKTGTNRAVFPPLFIMVL
jgi:hypothetical protein